MVIRNLVSAVKKVRGFLESSSGIKGVFPGGFEEKMTQREAILILNLKNASSEEKIKEHHRRLLMKNHPDKGGSTYLAFKINQAKDFLIKK